MDAYCYGNALARVLKDGEPDSLLTDCAISRREAFLAVTNPASIMNFKRDADSQEEDAKQFRSMFLNKLNTDPHFHKVMGKKLDALLPQGFERSHKSNGVLPLEEQPEKEYLEIGEIKLPREGDEDEVARQAVEVHPQMNGSDEKDHLDVAEVPLPRKGNEVEVAQQAIEGHPSMNGSEETRVF